MLLTRSAVRIAKPLWYSVTPGYSRSMQYMTTPCRYITAGQNYLRLGNLGGRMVEYECPPLDLYLGTWLERTKTFKEIAGSWVQKRRTKKKPTFRDVAGEMVQKKGKSKKRSLSDIAGLCVRRQSKDKKHTFKDVAGAMVQQKSKDKKKSFRDIVFEKMRKQKKALTWISYERTGDLWTCSTGYKDQPYVTVYTFKLGEETEINEGGVPLRVIITSPDGEILVERQQSIKQPDLVVSIVRKLDDDDTLVATWTFRDVVMVKRYKQVDYV